ncbi:MAG: hypothetical protein HYS52_01775 [Candidatus Wildermuthbacteria bacterium]|nr:hypothetical protein [Candidatus Wildermuthbacteria bacterium]
MYNWTTDENKLKKNKEKYAAWKLGQLINFGLDGEKIKREELKKYWGKLELDPARKRFLQLFLNG